MLYDGNLPLFRQIAIEKQGLAMRLEAGGGSVAVLVKNHPIFLPSYQAKGHFWYIFRTHPAALKYLPGPKLPPPPDHIDGGIDHQFEDGGGDDRTVHDRFLEALQTV
jgi:hypothetical protein